MVGRIGDNKRIIFAVILIAVLIGFIVDSCENPLDQLIKTEEQKHLDSTAPVISVFTLTSGNPATSREIGFTLSGSDDVTGISGWLVNETAAAPDAAAGGWVSDVPASYTLSEGDGEKTVYAWARDGAGNVSEPASLSVTLYTAGPATSFTLSSPTPTGDPTVDFTLAGDGTVTGWYVSESPTDPAPGDSGWVSTPPSSYLLPSVQGSYTIYAWAKNAGGILSVRRSIAVEISVEQPTSSMPSGSLITGHEKIVLSFGETMENTSAAFGGTIGGAGGIWSTTTNTDDTLTVSPSSVWSSGSVRSFVVDCNNQYGVPITQYSISYDVFHGICVSKDGNDTNDGTVNENKLTIRQGIAAAKVLYLDTGYASSAEVRVAAGEYLTDWHDESKRIEIEDAVSVYGGYAAGSWETRNPGLNIVTVKDTSTASNATAGTTESNPNRAVYCGPTVTSASVIDGFTIELTSTAPASSYNAAVLCFEGSPTISNNIIRGATPVNDSTFSYGIYIWDASPVIDSNDIDPGGKSGTGYTHGIYINFGASSPAITNNEIAGGYGFRTYAVKLYQPAAMLPVITDNIMDGGWGTDEAGCIYIRQGHPFIERNVFNKVYADYAILEYLSPDSNPSTLRNNDFNYTGYWYREYISSYVTVEDTNWDTAGYEISTQEGTDYLLNTSWGNYSTAANLP